MVDHLLLHHRGRIVARLRSLLYLWSRFGDVDGNERRTEPRPRYPSNHLRRLDFLASLSCNKTSGWDGGRGVARLCLYDFVMNQ